jgi:hypothetical protein
MSKGWIGFVVLSLIVALVGCSEAPDSGSAADGVDLNNDGNNPLPDAEPETAPDPTCTPSREIWDAVVSGMMERNCGQCHGEVPDFGAPNSLTDYDELIKGVEGQRPIDRIVARMDEDTMPPPAMARPPHVDRDTMVEWASCGLVHPDETVGLEVSREVFPEPEEMPVDTRQVNMIASDFEVGEFTLDLYQCFYFPSPTTGDELVKRIEPVIDESRVLHHLVLMEIPGAIDESSSSVCGTTFGDIIYAWAPGGGAIQFPNNGGFKIKSDKHYLVQTHYNNGAGIKDVKDNSGVWLYIGDANGPEYSMLSTGSGIPDISVPPGETAISSRTCTINKDLELLTGFPHMHSTGDTFRETIQRVDGGEELLIDLTGWRFEAQFFYDMPIQLSEGDEITTTCTYLNLTDETVRGGLRTEDEMCFDFIYATPAGGRCN